MTMQRYRELRKLSKYDLALIHRNHGGLLTVAEYLRWSKDELIAAVLEDETHATVTP